MYPEVVTTDTCRPLRNPIEMHSWRRRYGKSRKKYATATVPREWRMRFQNKPRSLSITRGLPESCGSTWWGHRFVYVVILHTGIGSATQYGCLIVSVRRISSTGTFLLPVRVRIGGLPIVRKHIKHCYETMASSRAIREHAIAETMRSWSVSLDI